MPKRLPEEIILRIYLLRRQGLTLDGIDEQLSQEFEEPPSRSSVARIVRQQQELPPTQLAEDVPFSWSSMTEAPWEASRPVLDAWTLYEAQSESEHFGPFTRRLAKWTWRVLQALEGTANRGDARHFAVAGEFDAGWRLSDRDDDLPVLLSFDEEPKKPVPSTPTAGDVIDVAREYAWREIASVVIEPRFDTTDLDMFLAFTPWRDRSWLKLYQRARDRSEIEMIHWHLFDLEWLDRVDPKFAQSHRERLPDMFQSPDIEAAQLATQLRLRKVDGLLRSQLSAYPAVSGTDSDEWFFDYLSEVDDLVAGEQKGGTAE